MSRAWKRLDRAYREAPCVPLHAGSKLVLMSDCHRGIGNWGDNFQPNQNLFFAALQYYNQRKFSYIELGDGDELWENRSLHEIVQTHSGHFWLMGEFYRDRRLCLIYGNHDRKKAYGRYFQGMCRSYYCEPEKKERELFPGLKVLEGVRLKDACSGAELFLVHGHQGDLWNDTLWRATRFLVRYLWRPLELLGCNDPTSAAKNYRKKEKVEKRLSGWADARRTILVAGHTHRPYFPDPGEGRYFNDGSCVHPRCVTALEVECGKISLVKWSVKVREDNGMYVGRDVLAGPVALQEYV